ncbi:replication factor A protein 2 [Loxospora ochrophaea]|nr:replication factor A protein 2 [Loxospora ochrophaea]
MDYNSYTGAQYTTYGAQGGADGGGFMGGSQGGSQGNPSGKGTYGKETLRPCTIHQILTAHHPHPDADFRISGVDVARVTLVGQIRSLVPQTTNTTYKLDDGTGTIEVKRWIDADANNNNPSVADPDLMTDDIDQNNNGTGGGKPELTEGTWVRAWGNIKEFNSKRHVGAHVLSALSDKNEIAYHLLETTYVHLYFTRGPLATSNPQQQNLNQPPSAAAGAAIPPNSNSNTTPSRLLATSPTARRIYEALQNSPQNNEGLHVEHLAAQLRLGVEQVQRGAEELHAEALIFTTVDDSTWAIMDC